MGLALCQSPSEGGTLVLPKTIAPAAFRRLTSSIVRVASTSVHTDTCGAEYADCTIADDVDLVAHHFEQSLETAGKVVVVFDNHDAQG